uniref:Core-2/I-branching beta-1,6-N-acetylglucosaminyltransferase family protein n=1 Tax=Kalanchoe fedtschenkoi TaxID=63787 RepID=A0A7N0UKU6_KALFE
MQFAVGSLDNSNYYLGTTARPKHPRPLQFRFLQRIMLFLVLGLGVCIVSLNTIGYFGQDAFPIMQSMKSQSCNLAGLRFPKSKPLHNLSDTELLKCASSASRIQDYRFAPTPKIAFMFLTKGPLPLAQLWERFFAGHPGLYSIYVHATPGYIGDYSSSSVFYHRQIPSEVVRWGEMSICDAERRLLASALLDQSNEYFVLLSESCIPIRNFTTVYNYIASSRYSFMGAFDEAGPVGRGRYNRQMAPVVKLSQWRKGSQWFEVSRKLAVDIIRDTKYYPKFRDLCKPSCYVDEHYFQTVLSIRSPHLLANRSLTFADWSRHGPHPATFGSSDIYEGLFNWISKSVRCSYNDQPSDTCFLFARKFAPSALQHLQELAKDMFGY